MWHLSAGGRATPLARIVPLEVAGRLALSVPAALWAWLLIGRLRHAGAAPWGALVLLPQGSS